MPCLSHRLTLLGAVAALILIGACSDDDPVTQPTAEPFSLSIRVLDADDQPLADQAVHVIPRLPDGILQDGKAAHTRAAVTIPFTVPRACLIDLVVRDVASDTVRVLARYAAETGQHAWLWDGRDSGGVHQPAGWYEVILTCRDAEADTVAYSAATGLLMVLLDAEQTPFRTDAVGEVVVTDRRVVPAFSNVPPLRLTDDIGELIMEYTLTTTTWIRVAGEIVPIDLEDGPQDATITVTLQPTPVRAGPWSQPSGTVVKDLPDPQDGFALGDPYPNPFN